MPHDGLSAAEDSMNAPSMQRRFRDLSSLRLTMTRSLQWLIVGVLACCGCSSYGKPVHFVVPLEFRGPICLILTESDGVEVIPTGGKYVYRVSSTGVMRVTSFKPFEPWHETTAAYEDGTMIPHELDRLESWRGPDQPEPKIGEDVVVFQGGSISQRNNGPYIMTFFVGTVAEFTAWKQQGNSCSDAINEAEKAPTEDEGMR